MAILTKLGIGKKNTAASGNSTGGNKQKMLALIAGGLVVLTLFLVIVFGFGGTNKNSESEFVANGLHKVAVSGFSFWVPEGYGLTGSDFGSYTFGNDTGQANGKPEIEIKKYVPYSKAGVNAEEKGASIELIRILNEARFTRNGSKINGVAATEKKINGSNTVVVRASKLDQTDPAAETRKYYIEQADGFIWLIKIQFNSTTDKDFTKKVDLMIASLESKARQSEGEGSK